MALDYHVGDNEPFYDCPSSSNENEEENKQNEIFGHAEEINAPMDL